MRRLQVLIGLIALLLGTWLVLPVSAQNYMWVLVNGIPTSLGSIAVTGQIQAADGTAAAPSVAFASDTTTGLYGGAGVVRVSAGGTANALVVTATSASSAGTFTSGTQLFAGSAQITAGSGTGVTVNNVGEVPVAVYKVTVTYANATTNGVTHDLTLATLPAKTFVKHILADVTTPYVCAQTCTTATLSGTVGSAAGGTQYLLSFDVDAAAAQFGDADAEFGASLAQATIPTPIGALGSWASTSPVSFRLTSGTGDLATTGVTNLNAGSITFYITTQKMP